MFSLFWDFWASWIRMFISLPGFRDFSGIILLNNFSAPFSFPVLSEVLKMSILYPLMVSHKLHRFSSLFWIVFSFCSCLDFKLSVKFNDSLFLSLLLKLFIEFFSEVTVFFSSRNCWVLFYLFVELLLLFMYCFPDFH